MLKVVSLLPSHKKSIIMMLLHIAFFRDPRADIRLCEVLARESRLLPFHDWSSGDAQSVQYLHVSQARLIMVRMRYRLTRDALVQNLIFLDHVVDEFRALLINDQHFPLSKFSALHFGGARFVEIILDLVQHRGWL